LPVSANEPQRGHYKKYPDAFCRMMKTAHRDSFKFTLLITTSGSGTGYYLVKCARKLGVRTIIAGDTNPVHLVASTALADKFIQLPPAADASFKERIKTVLREHKVDFWIPVLDEEIIEAARLAGTINGLSTVIHTQATQAAELCFDKLKMASWLDQHGFNTPRTQVIKEANWTAEGWFAKPRFGRGSVGATTLNSRNEFIKAKRTCPDLVVQEIACTPELTVDAFAPLRSGKVQAMCRERIEVKSGVCTKARVFYDAQHERTAQRLSSELNLRGGFCFQMLASKRGKWLITDINPRPGAGTAMSAAVGFDVGAALICDLAGLPFRSHLRQIKSPKYVVRAYQEYVTG
jgi:carbamoylphosphate synthase large subunit